MATASTVKSPFYLSVLACLFTFLSPASAQDHLLISELVVTPTAGEFIEIYNPTATVIDLTDYYLTDATFAGGNAYYYNLVTGADAGGGSSGDFLARFPAGASIAAGEYQTVAMNGADFTTTYGQTPSYELFDTGATVEDMLEALPGSINGQGGITNSGEVAILFFWDGQSDLVQDVDYLVWGDKVEAVDKTGIAIDGPDADSDASSYQEDTAIALQVAASSAQPHQDGASIQRFGSVETGETASGGNGISGNDETSENLAASFQVNTVTPNGPAPASAPPQISSVSRDPQSPGSADDVTIFATVTDDVELAAVTLLYSLDSGPTNTLVMSKITGDDFVSAIPAQLEGTLVDYTVRAEDSDGLVTNSAVQSYTVSAPPMLVPIADIQANPGNFTNVIVEAIVTVGSGRLITTRTDTYVQDNSGRGINVFSFDLPGDPPNDLLVRGNLLRITGTVEEFGGITEITNYSIELISSGNPRPAALELSTQEAGNTALEGTLLKTSGMVTELQSFADAANITIDDGSGPVLLRVWATTGIDLSGISVNDEITVTAVMDLFSDAAQLVPAYQDDILVAGQNPGDGSGIAVITPDSVAVNTATSEAITLTGESGFTLESVAVTIPQNWVWSNNTADVQLSGSGFSGASLSVQGGVITITAAAVSSSAVGSITINNLTSAGSDETSIFQIRTATAGGARRLIASSPAVVVGAGGAPATPIAQIQANPSAFTTVTIQGFVTIGAGRTIDTRTEAYLQDNSGRGINIFSFDPPTVAPNNLLVRGSQLRITGTVEEFQGITEITNYSIEVISTGNPPFSPLIISTQIANDVTLEGTYVQVAGIVSDIAGGLGGGTNITVNDGSGEVTIRVWDTSNLNLGFISVNDTLIARGVIDLFNNETQIVPAYQDELNLFGSGVVGDGSGFAAVTPLTVATAASAPVTVKVWSTPEDTLTTLRITVPYNWDWSGLESAVSLSGSSLSNASVRILREFDELFVEVSNAGIAGEDTAFVTINPLSAPDVSVYSYFWVKTGVAGGNPAFINESPRIQVGNEPIHQMRDIQTNSSQFSAPVTLRGVVTIADAVIRTDRTSAYFQDFSGFGLNINDGQAPGGRFPRGASLEISGGISEFGGTTQIAPASVSPLNPPLADPQPLNLSTGDAFSARWDGTLIQVGGIVTDKFTTSTVPPLDFNLVINDGSGEIAARVWATTGIDLDSINVNDAVILRGIGNVFISNGVNNYQILPGYQDQLELDPTFQPTLAGVSLSVPPNPFVPSLGETISISYNAGAVANRVAIRIFDLGGRLITTLLNEDASLIQNTLEWDGRDRLFNRVPLGAYICHLQVVEPRSGDKESRTVPIVVGAVLSR